jgi:hypothetical protein
VEAAVSAFADGGLPSAKTKKQITKKKLPLNFTKNELAL